MIAAALLLAQVAAPAVLHLRIETIGKQCAVRVNDRVVVLSDKVALDAALADLDPDTTEAEVSGPRETPYRCLGGIVYLLQVRGFRQIGYNGENISSPPAR